MVYFKKVFLSILVFIIIFAFSFHTAQAYIKSGETDTFEMYKRLAQEGNSLPLSSPSNYYIFDSPNLGPVDPPIVRKVMVVVFNPILESHGNQRLVDYKNYFQPAYLTRLDVNYTQGASGSHLNYNIVDYLEVDDIPEKIDGFHYTDEQYLTCVNSAGTNCHAPDQANYNKMLTRLKVCEKVNAGHIDEVWLWGGGWFGFFESNLTGPAAFWYNSSPTVGTGCERQVPIMGYNYTRNDGMLHSYGHRVEAVMTHLFGGWQQNQVTHMWEEFGLVDAQSPNFTYSGCGSIHYPPNAISDYDYQNTIANESTCNYWYNYPNTSGAPQSFNCSMWNCDHTTYLNWWHAHLPKYTGTHVTTKKWNNWWRYITDFRNAIVTNPYNCEGQPTIGLITPAHNFKYPLGTTIAVLQAGPVSYQTCNQARLRQIYIRDVTLGENFHELCFFVPTGDESSFTCAVSQLRNRHRYEWYAQVTNHVNVAISPTRSFTVGVPISPQSPPPSPSPYPYINLNIEDLNHDGLVNNIDYQIVLYFYGYSSSTSTPACGNSGDVDGDCQNSIFDINTIIQKFYEN